MSSKFKIKEVTNNNHCGVILLLVLGINLQLKISQFMDVFLSGQVEQLKSN